MSQSVKAKTKQAYNTCAKEWQTSRNATGNNMGDVRYVKQNRPYLFIEKPAMFKKLPLLKGKSVLCLGCGSGEECQMIEKKHPKRIVGIDIAANLIDLAKKQYPKNEFCVMDAESLTFQPETFDFVYSSLMVDYFKKWKRLLNGIFTVLKPGGTFLFSNLHPVKWGAEKRNDTDGKAVGVLLGYEIDNKTGTQVIYGNYFDTQLHTETWMGNMTVTFYTKSISTMVRALRQVGFLINDIVEPKAIQLAIKYDRNYYEANQKIPNFIIFECQKPEL